MNSREARQVQHNAPVHCADGKMGLIIRFWKESFGVQVPGEEDIREIFFSDIEDLGEGALAEVKRR